MPFPYKKVLIIGATSGIGEALATKLHNQNISVIVTGRRSSNLESFVASHPGSTSHTLDITSYASIPAFARTITTTHPDLDCIILNSGIQRRFDFSKPSSVDLELAETELSTNYVAYLHLLKAFIPFFQSHPHRQTSFIFTSSGLALLPLPSAPNYSASKAAMHSFIMSFREQMRGGPGDIRVVEILPPAVRTELHARKNQPDIEDENVGMPLEGFLEEAWEGLEKGEEYVPVGAVRGRWEEFEGRRVGAFESGVGMK